MTRRIGLVATGSRGDPAVVKAVLTLGAELYPELELVAHPSCGAQSGHFAGDDDARAKAFLDIANDPDFDALWFLRGGYGANRLIERVMALLTPAARAKAYLGYSDAGFLLGALYRHGFKRLYHGPMPQDLRRAGGEAAVTRSLAWLAREDPASLEPSVDAAGSPTAAFNLTTLSHLMGTPWLPDLGDHVLMLEEVSEPVYRIDRALFHITSNPMIRRVRGIRFGRCAEVIANEPDFGLEPQAVAQDWCARAGIAYLGPADIGHDIDNKIVPFGPLEPATAP